jgi:WD40 repeat protein
VAHASAGKLIGSGAFGPDGRLIASASGDRTINLWDPARPSRPPVALTGHRERVNSVAFSSDGRLLASASPRRHRRTMGRRPQTTAAVLTGHTAPVRTVAFTPNGRLLASGGVAGPCAYGTSPAAAKWHR